MPHLQRLGRQSVSDSKHTEDSIFECLAKRYRDDGWVRHGSAPGDVLLRSVKLSGRIADAVLVRCWASRGFEIQGFEIKCHRSDWLTELRKPQKSEEMMRLCNRWWLAAPTGVVKENELPTGWGFLQLRIDCVLVVKKPAPKLSPAPITNQLLARLVRRAYMAHRPEMDRIAEKARQEGYESGREQGRRDVEPGNAQRTLKRLQEVVEAFEQASGIQIAEPWQGADEAKFIGMAVKWLRDRRYQFTGHDVIAVEEALKRLLQNVTELRTVLQPILVEGIEPERRKRRRGRRG